MTSGSWRLSAGVRSQGTYTPVGAVKAIPRSLNVGPVQKLGFGTASGQADIQSVTRVTVTAGGAVTLDLYDGSVLDVFGQPAPFRTLRSVAVWVESGGDAAGVDVGDDGTVTNPARSFLKGTSPRATVYPGGPAYCGGSDAGVVVDATHRNLKLKNSGAADATVVVALAGGST